VYAGRCACSSTRSTRQDQRTVSLHKCSIDSVTISLCGGKIRTAAHLAQALQLGFGEQPA
jgi:hypothetical protein